MSADRALRYFVERGCTVQHRAVQDYDLPQRRLMHRTTMGGAIPL